MIGYIYKLVNKITGKVIYVGSTRKTVQERYRLHRAHQNCVDKRNYKLYIEIRKIGIKNIEAIEIEKVEFDDYDELKRKEQYWIDLLDTINNGCNGCKAIQKYPMKLSEEQKKINNQKVLCECCNKKVNRSYFRHHLKTADHIANA